MQQSFNTGSTVFSRRTEELHRQQNKYQHEPNLYMQQMCQNFTGLNLNHEVYSQQPKCNSDSGTSSADIDQAMIKDEVVYRMKDEVASYDMSRKAMPGPWYFEEGNGFGRSEDSASPTSDQSEDLANLLAGNRVFSQNVEVPSSEHVAEIVGRQGCKIKALRHKTSTYIKTPVRGDEPVFVVSGKQEDVMEAKREIECAAEHFTQIRASRRHSQGGAPAPGHITAYVRVPLRVVGLVVGPKGATIKRIQQDTHTYIITPSREREPVFEVTGLLHNVEAARKEIEQHIYQRTGNMPITDPSVSISNFQMPAGNHFENQNAMRPGFENMGAPIRRPASNNYQYPATERGDFAGLNTISNMLRYHTAPNQPVYGNENVNNGNHPAQFMPPPVQKRPEFPWTPNPYLGLGIEPASSQGSQLITGPSTWSLGCDSKEKRFGGSPLPSLGLAGMFDSIWADTQDENKQPSMTAHLLAA